MNNFINNLLDVMVITFLFILTVFMISILFEYIRMLWLRHKAKKANKEFNKAFLKAITDSPFQEKLFEEIAKQNKEPKKRGRKPKNKNEQNIERKDIN
jgi:23S rRNA maturation mini-RNase III